MSVILFSVYTVTVTRHPNKPLPAFDIIPVGRLLTGSGRMFCLSHCGDMDAGRFTSSEIHRRPELWDKDHAEPDIVVSIVGIVVVPVRRTAVLSVVVPAAAAQHAVIARFEPASIKIAFPINL